MEISVHQEADVTIVKLKGELQRQTVNGPQDQLLPLIVPDCKILVDMSEVSYMSSAGLRVLLLFYREINSQNGRIVLTGLPEFIHDTMSITGFLDFFDTYATVDEGMKALQQSTG
jgi:anti-sigma B factor antagonist